MKLKTLTPRQQQAYELRNSGLSHKKIAEIMQVNRERVRQWIARARHKMGLRSEMLDKKELESRGND